MPINAKNNETEAVISFADAAEQAAAIALAELAVEFDEQGIDTTVARDPRDLIQIYVTEHDERVRPSHAALHNTQWNPLDPNAPVPPLDWGCRCHLEWRAKDAAAAQRTGLPMAPQNPPKPGEEAFKRFFKGAKTSSDSATPGEPVTPAMIIGPRAASLLEQNKIKISDIFDENLATRNSTTLSNIAKAREQGRSVAAVTASTIFLSQTFGLSTSLINKTVKAAKAILKETPKLTQRESLIEALLKTTPGFVGTGRSDSTLRRARIVADRIILIVGVFNNAS